jgi:hypothetical protein
MKLVSVMFLMLLASAILFDGKRILCILYFVNVSSRTRMIIGVGSENIVGSFKEVMKGQA